MYFNEELKEITTYITKPLVSQTVYKLIEDLGLDLIFKDKVYINSNSMGASDSSEAFSARPKLKDNKFECVAREVFNTKNLKWNNDKGNDYRGFSLTPVYEKRQYPILNNETNQITIHEHAMPTNLVMECKLYFINKIDAVTTLSKLYTKYSETGMNIINANFVYSYAMPPTTLGILFLLYKMTKKPLSDFLTNLRIWSNNFISMEVGRDTKKDAEIIIQKNIAQTIVNIDFTQDEPEVEKSATSPDLFILNCTLTVQFNCPKMTILRYPVVVNNVLVPAMAIPVVNNSNLKCIQPTYNDVSFNEGTRNYDIGSIQKPVKIPWYDEWAPSKIALTISQDYIPFLISVVLLDTPDTVIDLAEPMAGVSLKKEVLDTLKIQGDASLLNFEKYNISVFSDNYAYEPSALTLTGGTKLTIPCRDKTKIYHLVISEKNYPAPYLFRFYVLDATILCQPGEENDNT